MFAEREMKRVRQSPNREKKEWERGTEIAKMV